MIKFIKNEEEVIVQNNKNIKKEMGQIIKQVEATEQFYKTQIHFYENLLNSDELTSAESQSVSIVVSEIRGELKRVQDVIFQLSGFMTRSIKILSILEKMKNQKEDDVINRIMSLMDIKNRPESPMGNYMMFDNNHDPKKEEN